MKLFKIYQNVNNGYDTYSDAIVCAETAEDAQRIHPSDYVEETTEEPADYDSWAPLSKVQVEYIGDARDGLPRGVVCASYHAG